MSSSPHPNSKQFLFRIVENSFDTFPSLSGNRQQATPGRKCFSLLFSFCLLPLLFWDSCTCTYTRLHWKFKSFGWTIMSRLHYINQHYFKKVIVVKSCVMLYLFLLSLNRKTKGTDTLGMGYKSFIFFFDFWGHMRLSWLLRLQSKPPKLFEW